MKLLILISCGFLCTTALITFVGMLVLNNRFDNRPEAAEFAKGNFPAPALDGSYKGTQFTGLGENWVGKYFSAAENEGINNFKGANGAEQRYPFQTSQQKGQRNKDLDVLQLNYDYKNNPLWLKFIKDEVVQVGPDKYLGKVHAKFGPFIVCLGYFQLSK